MDYFESQTNSDESEDLNSSDYENYYSKDPNSKSIPSKPKRTRQLKELIKIYDKKLRGIISSKHERRIIMKVIKSKSKKISLKELSEKWNEATCESKVFHKNSELLFSMGLSTHQKALKELSELKMPELGRTAFWSVPEESKELNNFLLNSIIIMQEKFAFNAFSENTIYCNNYFIGLCRAVSCFTNQIELYQLRILNQEFCTLVKASKHIDKLKFLSCSILSNNECNFGEMKNCKITTLDLKRSGNSENSNWDKSHNLCLNILLGIDKCKNLKESLNKMCLDYDSFANLKSDLIRSIKVKMPKIKHNAHLEFSFKTI